MQGNSMSFEQAINRLEEIVSEMETGKASLEESLSLFEEGSGLLRLCNGLLNDAEQKIDMIQQQDQSLPDGEEQSPTD